MRAFAKWLELKVPPVALSMLIAAVMWLCSAYVPSLGMEIPWRQGFALALVGIGIANVAAGVAAFHKAKTTVNPTMPEATSAVITSGVYGISRNPMYLGFSVVLGGWAAFLANALSFLLIPVFVIYMNRFQIGPEERALLARFGDRYLCYLQSVRRWL